MEGVKVKTAKLPRVNGDEPAKEDVTESKRSTGQTATRRYYVKTFGCQMNEHDSEKLGEALLSDGLSPAEDIDQADVVIFNTCCIRENADNKLYGHLGNLRERGLLDPNFQVVVAGCLAQRDREDLLKRAPYIDVVLGTNNTSRIADLLRKAQESQTSVVEVLDYEKESDDGEFFDATRKLWMESQRGQESGENLVSNSMDLPENPTTPRHSAFITIQAGCDNSCAFCIVPSVRGPEVSVAFGKLIDDINRLAESGVTEITLLGQNVNSYGRDITVALRRIGGSDNLLLESEKDNAQGLDNDTKVATGQLLSAASRIDYERYLAGSRWVSESRRPQPLFADLLRAIGEIDKIKRVRFTSPHPKDLRPETIEAMAQTPSVCEQLHLPLQSGSDAVLKAMRRGYNAETYLRRLESARLAIKDLAVTTDLIVGFPGESEKDFLLTLDLVAEIGFDSAYIFIFSPRKGTRAAEMASEFIDEEVIADRFARLNAVIERSALAKNLSRVNKVEEILVEGLSKKDSSYFTGRTRQGKLVHFTPRYESASNTLESPKAFTTGSSHMPTAGDYLSVKITSAAPHHLFGELI